MRNGSSRDWCLGLIAVLALGGAAAASRRPRPQVRVTTADGVVAGRALPAGVCLFAGIPFAAPPVGSRRWKAPVPSPPWRGVRVTRRFAPACMQASPPRRLGPWTRVFLSNRQTSENCLYLNLWVPPPGSRPGAGWPVMVWIYGGGFTSGAGSVPIYNGAALARRGVIVVNFNYRVGMFGFLALPALAAESPHHSTGDYALLDQIAALRWVRRNIAAFGGNPRNVTIFGQSAGAESVGLLVRSRPAQGLFARAIVMSGPAALPIPAALPLARAEANGERWMRATGAKSLAQLRVLSAQRLEMVHTGPVLPVQDGWVVPPGAGAARQVPVMIGMVADDIGIGYYGSGPRPAPSWAAYRAGLARLCGSQAAQCARLYPAANAVQGREAMTVARQDRARVSIAKWAAMQLRRSPRVYTYYFDHPIPWPRHPQYGVFHSSELPYVFANLSLMPRPWRAVDFRLERQMSSYWLNFAKTGDPNGPELPHWPRFNPAEPRMMQLGQKMGPMVLTPPRRAAFWRRRLKQPLG